MEVHDIRDRPFTILFTKVVKGFPEYFEKKLSEEIDRQYALGCGVEVQYGGIDSSGMASALLLIR